MKMIVIGGSAGSMEPILTILGDLPAQLDAAVLILRHSSPLRAVRPGSANDALLAKILAPRSRLPVCEVTHGMPVLPGTVYVAPSGTHVIVSEPDDRERRVGGARARFELHPSASVGKGRPSIDLGFASAAEVFGPDCIGVVLSGLLDDGTEGAQELFLEHGTMIVQAPGDADQASMPNNVIRRDHPDYILPDVAIGQTLVNLVQGVPAGGELALGRRAVR